VAQGEWPVDVLACRSDPAVDGWQGRWGSRAIPEVEAVGIPVDQRRGDPMTDVIERRNQIKKYLSDNGPSHCSQIMQDLKLTKGKVYLVLRKSTEFEQLDDSRWKVISWGRERRKIQSHGVSRR
jgi:hypothetical protein